MEASSPGKIEVFAPFSSAIDLTKLILFQPFDLAKWFTIGFAAFLSHLTGGNGFHFNYKMANWGKGDWNWRVRSTSHDPFGFSDGWPAWLLPLILVAVVVGVAAGLVLMWVGARGRFVFVDCIVRNRGAIVEPWHEFRREGNSYFLFSILLTFVVLSVVGLAGFPLWLPLVTSGNFPEGVGLVFGIGLLGLAVLCLAVAANLIITFMVPVMYRRRCGATEGFKAALAAIMAQPGPVVLYLLFSIVIGVAIAIIACLTTCVTCCITAIPYVGTVILLPLYVFLMSYLLLFVRQFGDSYDVWANIIAAGTPVPPAEPPSLEPPPLPA